MSDPIIEKRFRLLDSNMESENLDAVVVYGKGMVTQYGYLYYFATFYPALRPGIVVKLKGENPVVFYTTRADYYLAKEKGTIADVRYAGIGDVVDSQNGILAQIASLINESGAQKIGICGLNSLMTYEEANYFLKNLNGEVVDSTYLVQKMKALKSEEEKDSVRETFHIAERSFEAFEKEIAAGRVKSEIGAEVDKIARSYGAISTLVFLEDGPYFLRKPPTTPLKDSGLITAYSEIVGPNGYWVEKGGLFAIGELSKEEEEIGQACVNAMYAIKEIIKPGIKVSDLADTIKSNTNHLNVHAGIWPGHGVGIDHDIPVIREDSDSILEPGMVVSVHPNISNNKETIGASIADVFLIHDNYAESLSETSYDIKYL